MGNADIKIKLPSMVGLPWDLSISETTGVGSYAHSYVTALTKAVHNLSTCLGLVTNLIYICLV